MRRTERLSEPPGVLQKGRRISQESWPTFAAALVLYHSGKHRHTLDAFDVIFRSGSGPGCPLFGQGLLSGPL